MVCSAHGRGVQRSSPRLREARFLQQSAHLIIIRECGKKRASACKELPNRHVTLALMPMVRINLANHRLAAQRSIAVTPWTPGRKRVLNYTVFSISCLASRLSSLSRETRRPARYMLCDPLDWHQITLRGLFSCPLICPGRRGFTREP